MASPSPAAPPAPPAPIGAKDPSPSPRKVPILAPELLYRICDEGDALTKAESGTDWRLAHRPPSRARLDRAGRAHWRGTVRRLDISSQTAVPLSDAAIIAGFSELRSLEIGELLPQEECFSSAVALAVRLLPDLPHLESIRCGAPDIDVVGVPADEDSIRVLAESVAAHAAGLTSLGFRGWSYVVTRPDADALARLADLADLRLEVKKYEDACAHAPPLLFPSLRQLAMGACELSAAVAAAFPGRAAAATLAGLLLDVRDEQLASASAHSAALSAATSSLVNLTDLATNVCPRPQQSFVAENLARMTQLTSLRLDSPYEGIHLPTQLRALQTLTASASEIHIGVLALPALRSLRVGKLFANSADEVPASSTVEEIWLESLVAHRDLEDLAATQMPRLRELRMPLLDRDGFPRCAEIIARHADTLRVLILCGTIRSAYVSNWLPYMELPAALPACEMLQLPASMPTCDMLSECHLPALRSLTLVADDSDALSREEFGAWLAAQLPRMPLLRREEAQLVFEEEESWS